MTNNERKIVWLRSSTTILFSGRSPYAEMDTILLIFIDKSGKCRKYSIAEHIDPEETKVNLGYFGYDETP